MKTVEEMRKIYAEKISQKAQEEGCQVRSLVMLWVSAIDDKMASVADLKYPCGGVEVSANQITSDYADPVVWRAALATAQAFSERNFKAHAQKTNSGSFYVSVSWANDCED